MSNFSLRTNQIDDLAFMISEKRSLMLHDPGVGKTPPVCCYIEYLYKHLGKATIWIMPDSLCGKNVEELKKFTQLKSKDIVYLTGNKLQKEELLKTKAICYIMNFTVFIKYAKELLDTHKNIDALIIDEFQMGGFKSHNTNYRGELTSVSVKVLYEVEARVKHIVIMSGTLLSGKLDACYASIRLMSKLYYYSHKTFMATHSIPDSFGKTIRWVNHERIAQIFNKHGRRRTFEQEYGEVKKVILKEKIELDSKTRAAYSRLENEALIEMSDRFVDAGIPAVKTIRCRQLLAHPYTFEVLRPEIRTNKEEALAIHIQNHLETGEPLIIYATLQPEQQRIFELVNSLGMSVELINGTVNKVGQRQSIDERFQAGKFQCIVGSPATASVGFNWGHVNHVIFVSLDYQEDNFIQAYRRTTRSTRDKILKITILEYEKTIEQRILQIIDKKSANTNKIDSTYELLELSKI